MMQRALGACQCFPVIGLGDAEHSQQNGVKQGPPSDEEEKTKPITQYIKLSERILRSKPTRSSAPNKNHPPDNTVTPAS